MKVIRLEKFQSKARNSSIPKNSVTSEINLRKTDWDVLMMHDRFTGKLDLKSKFVINDPKSVKRLLEAKMILPDGKLTPVAKRNCTKLAKRIYKRRLADSSTSKMLKAKKMQQAADKRIVKLTTSDRAILNKYDRKSGNLLKYDPATGQLDEGSRKILREPIAIQRLIDRGMILLSCKIMPLLLSYSFPD